MRWKVATWLCLLLMSLVSSGHAQPGIGMQLQPDESTDQIRIYRPTRTFTCSG